MGPHSGLSHAPPPPSDYGPVQNPPLTKILKWPSPSWNLFVLFHCDISSLTTAQILFPKIFSETFSLCHILTSGL